MPETLAGGAAVEFAIRGVAPDGAPFRPSDRAERLCGVRSAPGGEHRMRHSPCALAVTSDGVHCVAADLRRRQIAPTAFRFRVNFARDDGLQTRRPPRRAYPSSRGCSAPPDTG